ncbi:hypothetical protein N9X25_09415 [Verrucomicrobiales bacterium]|nr:hypothetical protein [Verrucomicrobiales bacterium]
MKTRIYLLTFFALTWTLLAEVAPAQVTKPVEVKAPNLRGIWKNSGAQKRLLATRAAELDGDRLLIERIYGLEIASETSVGELALVDDDIRGVVMACLVGAVSVGEPEYLPDGRVQVVRAVKVREVIESLNRVVKNKRSPGGDYSHTSEKTEFKRDTIDKLIEVMGNAALPGSPGHNKIGAKRAAELDAYRRLAGRMMGVQITSDSTVRDFCLGNDKLTAALSQKLKAAKPTAIEYSSDGSCQVTMQIAVEDIVQTTKSYLDSKLDKLEITEEVEQKIFSETGNGAASSSSQTTNGAGSISQPFAETEIFLREVIHSAPVVQ